MTCNIHKCIDELGRKVKEDGKQLFFYIFDNRRVNLWWRWKKIQIID